MHQAKKSPQVNSMRFASMLSSKYEFYTTHDGYSRALKGQIPHDICNDHPNEKTKRKYRAENLIHPKGQTAQGIRRQSGN